MTKQVNLRLPEKLLNAAEDYAEKQGYGTLQEFVKDVLRKALFDQPHLSKEELAQLRKLLGKSK